MAGASPATVSRLGVVHLATTPAASLLSPLILNPLSSIVKNIASQHLSLIVMETLKLISSSYSSSSLITAALCHLAQATTQNHATYSLLLSICLQINDLTQQEIIARLIYQTTDSWCPDPKKPLDILYNAEIDRLEPYGDTLAAIQTDSGPISLSSKQI